MKQKTETTKAPKAARETVQVTALPLGAKVEISLMAVNKA